MERLQHQMELPQLYRENILKDERRRIRAKEVQHMKLERVLQSEAEKKRRELQSKEERRKKLKEVVEMARLREQAKRNTARTQQELAEMMAYEKQYGRVINLINVLPEKLLDNIPFSLVDSWPCGIATQMRFTTSK